PKLTDGYVVKHVRTDDEVGRLIDAALLQRAEAPQPDVTGPAPPRHRIPAGVDAEVAGTGPRPAPRRQPASPAAADIEDGPERASDQVLGRGDRQAHRSLEVGRRGYPTAGIAIPAVEVLPVVLFHSPNLRGTGISGQRCRPFG